MMTLQIKYKGKVAGQVTVSANIKEKASIYEEEAPSIVQKAFKDKFQKVTQDLQPPNLSKVPQQQEQ